MTDIFGDAHRKAAQDAIRRQADSKSKALTEATRRRVANDGARRKLSPNADIGYRPGRRSYVLIS